MNKAVSITAFVTLGVATALGIAYEQSSLNSPVIEKASFVSAPIPLQPTQSPSASEPGVSAPVALAAAVGQATNTQATPNIASDDTLKNLTLQTLSNLNSAPTPQHNAQVADAATDQYRSMTAGVLNALPSSAISQSGSIDQLQAIILKAMQQGKSNEYIDSLLNKAAFDGSVQVPAGLVTAEGRVDTKTLIASLVAKPAAQPKSNYLNMINSLAASAFTDTPAAPIAPQKPQIYTVVSGDSLASISLKYYGTTTQYQQIFEANLDKITSPDKIRIGQKLVIPAL